MAKRFCPLSSRCGGCDYINERYEDELLEKYSDTHKALMAYNCGETGAKRLWNQGYLTSTYSRKVVTNYEKWQQIINK